MNALNIITTPANYATNFPNLNRLQQQSVISYNYDMTNMLLK
jgi:hypothetical protein